MQTFLHNGSCFTSGARILDRQRLGKQRVEAWQILRTITGETHGWANHPAVKMWVGHDRALALYGYTHCWVWRERGYKDSLMPRFIEYLNRHDPNDPVSMPDWIDDRRLVLSHQSNLIRKRPDIYGPYWPLTPPDLPYFWPV